MWVLFLKNDGTVKSHQKISEIEGGATPALEDNDFFASALALLGDVNGDGSLELAVGATYDDDGGHNHGSHNGANIGALYILSFESYPLHSCAQPCTDGLTCDRVRALSAQTAIDLFAPLDCPCGLCGHLGLLVLSSPPPLPPASPPAPPEPPTLPPPGPGLPPPSAPSASSYCTNSVCARRRTSAHHTRHIYPPTIQAARSLSLPRARGRPRAHRVRHRSAASRSSTTRSTP